MTISDDTIRRQYDEKTKNWYFSVIDVIAIVSESSDARNYWKVLKSRLQKANPQLVTACNQLKLPSSDGKSYLTDVATSEILLEIITTISLPYVAPFRLWFEKIESSSHLQNSFPQFENDNELAELPIDIYQRNGALIIEALVAGTNPEDIIIRTTYEGLTISGSRKMPGIFSKEDTLTQELFYGNFSRTINFPVPIELDRIEAHISHGFLTIMIPLVDTKRTRIIKIKSV
jgi:HSP20 family molecular chaperone IbpA